MFDQVKERALKITEALYRTTELFSDAEPLKWSLRQTALEILNAAPQDLPKFEALVKNLFLKLELASSGTFISKMNFDVLKREYTKLLSDIVSYKESYQALLDDITRSPESRRISDTVKEVVQIKKEETKKTNSNNTGRRQALLEKLKEKGPSSVGELVGTFNEPISGKTVQRELNAMVMSGDIRKEGEKRWRRYFI
ncbi:hypothetical protein A2W54_01225 [Candidatus Giovannonibacteria bacterium RIFCSPHIGHO2_02_43_13]|uniref:HTH deoR-type domain-containing protein n=1 Tax=Candidatus Giovannonibacteria bacterium RIFCSPHIGHO2_02_43_13 TaxID=1798330 RepID=A0A1F5WUM2_9BACT|nr:MAG: hypothetical protein UW28_C0001G0005 [Parcubacteria group bacterium GW2011_GWA2_44_13]OGF72979.1 MAG: hypothetical protein A3E06_03290 [Candidatus Giovannonibacteria bacterium RIFCSPHIGHO2_12_FULL_44_42]OGF79336.1 MAG: hypothetical protein A2W54_01225 [Candidatus Giovannonibacteria bacterium RIFCSPHIGHO2_02_43_13]OGF90277.1 MAG: hypothetical protein A3I94_01625 [Candidatus Giovannonibacteria bacterium RIFCSPLOWO2_02_FULL_43_54]OGF97259.1 MAG: hypothetical protein A3H08_02795 [Candidatus